MTARAPLSSGELPHPGQVIGRWLADQVFRDRPTPRGRHEWPLDVDSRDPAPEHGRRLVQRRAKGADVPFVGDNCGKESSDAPFGQELRHPFQ